MQNETVNKINHRIRKLLRPKPPITNLVFKGGGIRGIAYLGALQVLEQYNLLKDIKRVGGTSAGSLSALLLSMHLSLSEIEKILSDIDYPKIAQEVDLHYEHKLVKSVTDIMPDTACVQRFRNRYGWYANQNLHRLLEEMVARGCQGNPRATFEDFEKMGHHSLFIVASNVSRYRREVFSAATTPHVAVADAALMSSSIPIFFEPVRFDGKKVGEGDYYVDGGLYDNYPIHIFDSSKYVQHRHNFINGINLETIGMFLFPARSNKDDAHFPNRWHEFVELVFSNLYFSHQVQSIITSRVDKNRTIRISDCGIKATDFKILAGSDKYNQLMESGKSATQNFLEEQGYIYSWKPGKQKYR